MDSTSFDEENFVESHNKVAVSQENEQYGESSQIESLWRGTPLDKLPRNTHQVQFPIVVVGPQHSVLFKLPVKPGEVPLPWPEKPVDKWDQNHVRMPHSPSSLYPVTESELRTRWELVQGALATTIMSSHQLEAAILHYNSMYSDRWDFKALHDFFSETLEEVETEYFFKKVLPNIIVLALSVPKLVTNGILLLRQHKTQSISLTQQQISCLLANAFLCTFPRRNTSKKNSEYSTFPYINFNRLFNGDNADKKGRTASLHEKLKCLINYFRRVTSKVPNGIVTYSRHYISPEELPVWSDQTAQLRNLYISNSGTIEEGCTGMLQMDFANKMVGGGVLGRGSVQEEIRFVICPELILSRLFTEVLDETEALIVTGCETFNKYEGYAETFEWTGNFEDPTPRDRYGRRYCTIVAIDALRFPSAKTQYTAANINRELNKAYTGFSWGIGSGSTESVATGNWGCGAYRGDAYLKSLLQLMAAAATGRDLAYFTFGNEELRDQVADMHSFLLAKSVTLGNLWKIITSYNPTMYRHSLYDHIYQAINSNSSMSSPIHVHASTFKSYVPTPWKEMSPLAKKPRVHEGLKGNMRKQEVVVTNGKLSNEDIEEALESLKDLVAEPEVVEPVEAKMLNIQKDKELCLKRLSSSWTNLNESKKDFDLNESASTSELISKTSHQVETISGEKGQCFHTTRKKRISDYFQPVSKS